MSCKETFNTGLGYIAYAFNRVYEINEYLESENAKLQELACQQCECDTNPCIELGPKMAVPKEMRTDYDYGTMVTANILMTVSIDSLGRKNDQLQAENAKLRKLVADMFVMCTSDCLECEHGYDNGSCRLYDRMRELGVEADL